MLRFLLLSLTLLSFGLISCSLDDPLSSQEPAANSINILKAKSSSLHKLFSDSRYISDAGGRITLGDSESGISFIDFPEDALEDDDATTVYFTWQSEGLMEAEFAPHGLQFHKPVRLRLSYKDADLGSIDENDLNIYYYNQDTGNYELQANIQRNMTADWVECDIYHFSRYAIATE